MKVMPTEPTVAGGDDIVLVERGARVGPDRAAVGALDQHLAFEFGDGGHRLSATPKQGLLRRARIAAAEQILLVAAKQDVVAARRKILFRVPRQARRHAPGHDRAADHQVGRRLAGEEVLEPGHRAVPRLDQEILAAPLKGALQHGFTAGNRDGVLSGSVDRQVGLRARQVGSEDYHGGVLCSGRRVSGREIGGFRRNWVGEMGLLVCCAA